MRKKNTILLYTGLILFAFLSLVSCKKQSTHTLTNIHDDSALQSVVGADEVEINNVFEQVLNEVIKASSITPTTNGKIAGNILYTTIVGGGIDTNQLASGIIKITYYGQNLEKTKGRHGIVYVKFELDSSGKVVPWKIKGTTIVLTFDQYEVVYLLKANKSIWLNGTCTITNTSGGTLGNISDSTLVPGNILTDKVRAQLTFTHDDHVAKIQTWPWNFNRTRTFSLKDTNVVVSIKGDTTLNGISNVVSWGTARSESPFYTEATTPVEYCISGSGFLIKPLNGAKVIHGIPSPITITYGVDNLGNPVTTGNPFGFRLNWLLAGYPKKAVLAYE